MKKSIRVIAKRVGEDYFATTVENSLEEFQRFVGGYIEAVPFSEYRGDVMVICNEEGLIRHLPFNCRVNDQPFFGDIFIVGVTRLGEFKDVPADLRKGLKERAL